MRPPESPPSRDQFFWVAAQQAIRHRSPSRSPTRSRSGTSVQSNSTSSVTTDQLTAAGSRFCGDLSRFIAHGESIQKTQKRAHRVCAVCGKHCHHLCALCKDDKHKNGVPLHKPPATAEEKTCFCQFHNALFCGLARADTKLVGSKRKDHCHPTADAIEERANAIKI